MAYKTQAERSKIYQFLRLKDFKFTNCSDWEILNLPISQTKWSNIYQSLRMKVLNSDWKVLNLPISQTERSKIYQFLRLKDLKFTNLSDWKVLNLQISQTEGLKFTNLSDERS